MASEHLDNLAARGLLKAEAPTVDEVSGLIRSGAARLADAKNESLSREPRFDLLLGLLSRLQSHRLSPLRPH